MGYVGTDEFRRTCQMTLQVGREQADLLLESVPFQGNCGSVAYRRWLAEFCRSPRVGWQSYLNMNLMATGSRELDLQHAEQAAATKARASALKQYQEACNERALQADHALWRHQCLPGGPPGF